MKIQISFEIRKNSDLYLMKIQISFEFKKKSFDAHQQILKSKNKIKTNNQLKNMSKKISTRYLSMANMN